jgi:uncharacterized protein (TIGR03437 family)
VRGSDGNFYGTTETGGAYNSGTVFKLSPIGTVTTLYSFGAGPNDGFGPIGGVVQATDGNFYGTTANGGTNFYGTVFRLTPAGALTILYNFGSTATDGLVPRAGLVQATDGNLYGSTLEGGTKNAGTIFRMTLPGTLTIVHNFAGFGIDGAFPAAELVQAVDGNLYGTTNGGSTPSAPTIFKMTLSGSLTNLHTFPSNFSNGGGPFARLIQATDGNFYGTTTYGGSNNTGTFFKMTRAGTVTTLHSFNPQNEAFNPIGGLAQSTGENFYGADSAGGINGYGTIFEVDSCGTVTTLHSFNSTDGAGPLGNLIQTTSGQLYGTTYSGGANNDGTVFGITLPPIAAPVIMPCGGVVNGASFQPGIAPDSWFTIFGANLSSTTDTWTVVNGILPTSLDGVKVTVGGMPAYISYISPTQINGLAPGIASGDLPVTVTNSVAISAVVTGSLQAVQPAFFQWGNYAVATRQDYSLAVQNGTFPSVTTVPAKPGDVIILWGTGFGPTHPAAPEGSAVPSSPTYNTANPVTVTVGNVPATVYGAALSAGYAGLYQVAIQIPLSLANGDYPIVSTVSGVQSPSTTLITVQN